MATSLVQDHLMVPMHSMDDSPDISGPHDAGRRFDQIAPRTISASDGPPLPNPPFSFPAQPDPTAAMPSLPRPIGRQRLSALDRPASSGMDGNRGPSALPVFSFNPGASLPTEAHSTMFLNPSMLPNVPRTGASTQRPGGHGHRRGGSEFVGGRLREGSSIAVMSSSPTKEESGFASPNFVPPRRGHRRGISSAISTNDLPILQPPNFSQPKGSSAPTSPTNFNDQMEMSLAVPEQTPQLPEPIEQQFSEDQIMIDSIEPEVAIVEEPPKPPTRTRVGFSDTLEFIPRPLSLISSDTSSTITTTRPGHSVSDSISSIVPPLHDSHSPLSRSPPKDTTESRPSTAGAVLERAMSPELMPETNRVPKRRNSTPTLADAALEDPSDVPPMPNPRASKRWTFFGLEQFSISPNKGRPTSASSTESVTRAVSAGSSSENGSDSTAEAADSCSRPKKMSKKGKKTKKVKGWAGAFLHGKPKSQSKSTKEVRPPTPPAPTSIPLDDEEEEEEEDTIMPDRPPMPTVVINESEPLDTPPKRSDEAMSPMIDLDAALGPFNTPLPHNPEWEAAQQAAGNTGKRRLHSAQGMRGFTGPGMHYHRRAESAPDLPPFDPGRSAVHRFSSNSTMADVFEEDEDEEGHNAQNKSGTTSQSDSSEDSDGDVTPPASDPKDGVIELQKDMASAPPSIRRKSSGLSEKDESAARSVRTERSRTSLHENVIAEEVTPSIIFRNANVFQARRDSNESAGAPPRKFYGNMDVSPMELKALHHPNGATMPLSPYPASQSSSYPSPRSPVSEAQRMSTAPSSINEETSFQSLLMGEPGPEVRLSMDYDVPSLTSSTSTMTRESFAPTLPTQRLSQPSLREQRPVSVSSAAFGRRRSSLVSLSRLISSSHGERSKLSMEVTLDDSEGKKSRQKKSKRLGRMMQFWKPSKETAQ